MIHRAHFELRRDRRIRMPAASSPRPAEIELPLISGTPGTVVAESGTSTARRTANKAPVQRHTRLIHALIAISSPRTLRCAMGETPTGRLAVIAATRLADYFERRRALSTRMPPASKATPAESDAGPISGTDTAEANASVPRACTLKISASPAPAHVLTRVRIVHLLCVMRWPPISSADAPSTPEPRQQAGQHPPKATRDRSQALTLERTRACLCPRHAHSTSTPDPLPPTS